MATTEETPARKAARKPAKKRRFWQCRRDLPSVIWNGRKGKVAVRFTYGTAVVQDEGLAKRLAAMGYMEVPMENEIMPTPRDDSMPVVGLSSVGSIKVAPKAVEADASLKDLDLDSVPDSLYGQSVG